ncbi:DUF935 family protein [Blastomonas sp. AAP25]|uniref:phage portal protein family protein n=1 Tax=Blastomonas sp. AAP25 TaxID=1523416 RepID=UPI0006B91E04|nr:DUF935 family protein [Blastomonas sp. AAP25]
MAQRPRPFSASTTRAIARRTSETSGNMQALMRPIATTSDGRDITRPFVSGLQQPRDPRISMAIDWGVYDVILEDDQVFSTLQQRIGGVVSRNWNVVPGDENDPRSVEAAEKLSDNLLRLGWDRVTRKMLFATFYGYSVAECMWEVRDGLFQFKDLKVRHARRFRYDDAGNLRLITRVNWNGELLPDRKFWVATAGASDDDEIYGRGLAEWLYWPTLFKRNGLRFWNNFLDKFGAPTAVGKYPSGTPQDQVNNLLSALQAIQTDTGIAIPERMVIELLQVAKSGVADYEQLCRYMDECIAKVVLSQTMTTQDGSSLSQAQVHAGVKLEVVKSDADLLSDSFNAGPARWWTDFNYGPDVASPRVMRDVEEETDTKLAAETDNQLKGLGWERTEESFQDTYGDGYVRVQKADTQTPDSAQLDPVADQKLLEDNRREPLQPVTEFAADDPRPLYVHRKLVNAEKLVAWARKQGFKTVVDPADMHVTVAYSKKAVNWFGMGDDYGFYREPLRVMPGGPRVVDRLGDQGAVVLHFWDGYLANRHRTMREAGASWDFPTYLPHVTFTYEPGEVDLAAVEPFTGELLFGPEIFEPIDDDWASGVRSVDLAEGDPDYVEQSLENTLIDELIAAEDERVTAAMTGSIFDRISAAATSAELLKLLDTEATALMNDAPLRDSIERAAFAMRLAEENREGGA